MSFLSHVLYGILHDSNFPDLTVDTLTTNPRPSFFGGAAGPQVSPDGKKASGTDRPGAGSLPAGSSDFFVTLDFETRVHLNFEVPSNVKIIRKDGSPPQFGVVTGVVDPEPLVVDSGTWNVRILQARQPDGSVVMSHPDTFAGP